MHEITVASSGGASGQCAASGTGSTNRMFVMIAAALAPENGGVPVAHS